MLSLHIKDSSKAKLIAETLNGSFYHHGYPVGFKEAKEIGLPVVAASGEIGDKIWAIWQDIEDEMKCNEPFNPVGLVLADPRVSALVEPVTQIQLPANLPAPVAQQAYNQVLQQINLVNVPPIEYNLFQATLESSLCKSEFRTKGKINAVRSPDMNLAVNLLPVLSGWVFSENNEDVK